MILLLGLSIVLNGRSFRGDVMHLFPFDQVPTEIAAGLCLVGAILWWMLGNRVIAVWRLSLKRYTAAVFLQAAGFYEIGLLGLHSLLRRIYGGNFWRNSVLYYVAVGFLVVAAIIWFIGRIVRTRSEFAVTNSRFIQKDGILNIKMTEIPLFKIETVNFYQSFWQRLLGTGCIELVGSGGTFHRVHFIQHPQRVRKTIVSTINEHGHNEQE
jgi:membrane protein YdbS with pleckstrin-like domain